MLSGDYFGLNADTIAQVFAEGIVSREFQELNAVFSPDGNEFYFDVDWCIGGKKTYEKYAPFFTELHISHIDNNDIGDVMFPNFIDLNSDCKIFNYNY